MNGPQSSYSRNFHPTRFYGLAPCFNNKGKANKFLYAFSIQPLQRGVDASELFAAPNATPFPFSKFIVPKEPTAEETSRKRKLAEAERFDSSVIDYNKVRPSYALPGNGKRRRQHHLTSGARADECWFCMSSSVCEMHLIVSVASHFYLALAKGAMSETHMLLSPVLHFPNGAALDAAQRSELEDWKAALRRYHDSNNMVPIFFELAPPEGKAKRHMLLQCVPILRADAPRTAQLFMHEANAQKLDLVEMDKDQLIGDAVGRNTPYFWLELANGTQYVASLEDLRVPFSFGRLVLSKIMGNTRLEDWKRCVVSEQEEVRITNELRESFSPFELPTAT